MKQEISKQSTKDTCSLFPEDIVNANQSIWTVIEAARANQAVTDDE